MAQSSEQKPSDISARKVSTMRAVDNASGQMSVTKGLPAPGPNDINPVRQELKKEDITGDNKVKQVKSVSTSVTEQKQPE